MKITHIYKHILDCRVLITGRFVFLFGNTKCLDGKRISAW